MASTSETGHAKIPANMYSLIGIAKRYPAKYKPTNAKLAIPAIENLVTAMETAVDNVREPEKTFIKTRGNRQALFATLKPIATSAVNSLGSLDGVDASLYKQATTLLKKITGANTSKKETATEPSAEGVAATETPKKHSASQQSYVMRVNNLKALIAVLQQIPQYAPAETEISIAALTTLADDLTQITKDLGDAYTPYAKALQARDTLLYHPETGAVALSKKLKKYISSVKDISAADKAEAKAIGFKSPGKNDLFL